jgi:RNA recognition motif-containing protein
VAYSREGDKIKGANLHVRNIPKTYEVADLQQAFSSFGEIIQCTILNEQTTGRSRGMGFVLFNTKDEAEAAMNSLNGTTLPDATAPLEISFAEDKMKAKIQTQIATQAAALYNSYASSYNVPMGFGATPRSLLGGTLRGALRGRGMRGGGPGGPMKNQLPRHRFNPLGSSSGFGVPSISPVSSLSSQGHIIYAYNIGPQTTQEELQQLFSLYGTVTKVDVIWDQQKNMGKGYGFVTMPNYEEAVYAIQCLSGYNYAGKPMQVSFKTQKAGM